jgi:hypothetical protein
MSCCYVLYPCLHLWSEFDAFSQWFRGFLETHVLNLIALRVYFTLGSFCRKQKGIPKRQVLYEFWKSLSQWFVGDARHTLYTLFVQQVLS